MAGFEGFTFDVSTLTTKNVLPEPAKTYDLLIIGGGPAAMTAVVYAARKMMKVALLTKDLGGQISKTSEIENYMGFQSISGRELVEKFKEQVIKFNVPILLGKRVEKVEKENEVFKAHLLDGTVFSGKCLIMATGKRSRYLNVPGEKELIGKGVAICATCDAPFYKNKKVVVVGGGNSAFTSTMDLLKLNAEVILINFSEGWQADEILIKGTKKYGEKLTLLDYHRVTKINGKNRVSEIVVIDRNSDKEQTIAVDGVFIEIGLIPNSEPIKYLAELNELGELVVDCHCRTSVKGLFGAGDITTVPHKQIIISSGEGAKAALSSYGYLVLKGQL